MALRQAQSHVNYPFLTPIPLLSAICRAALPALLLAAGKHRFCENAAVSATIFW
jgi:hypothetical protein